MLDPETFLNSEVEGASSTEFVNIPVDEYICMIPEDGLKGPRELTNKDGDKSYVMDILWEIIDEEKKAHVQEVTGMSKPRLKQSLFLDVIANNDGVVVGLAQGPGKNVQLGRLREALNQNDPKKRWSFQHLVGATARVKAEETFGSDGTTYVQAAKKDGVTRL